jgi:hypothetical protein
VIRDRKCRTFCTQQNNHNALFPRTLSCPAVKKD